MTFVKTLNINSLFAGPNGLSKLMIDTFGTWATLTNEANDEDEENYIGSSQIKVRAYLKNNTGKDQDVLPGNYLRVLIAATDLKNFIIIEERTRIEIEKNPIIYTVVTSRVFHTRDTLSHYELTCAHNQIGMRTGL